MKYQRSIYRAAIALLVIAFWSLWVMKTGAQQTPGNAGMTGPDVTILVTVDPHDDRARAIAAKLQPEDFTVLEEQRKHRFRLSPHRSHY
jgi:hypothetical protein